MISRLLMVAGGGGAVTLPGPTGSWTRYSGNPVLEDPTPTIPSAQEVSVFYRGVGDWILTYRGGWHTAECAVGVATSSDGLSWTRYAGNPVLGQGGSGVAGNVVQPCTMLIGSTYYCYYNDGSQAKHLATSSDLYTWTPQSITINFPTGMTLWGDSYVWTEGATWYGLFDCSTTGTYWRLHLYTSSDGQTWSIQNGGAQLSSLQISSGAMYGSAFMANGGAKVGGRYQLWYHAAPSSALSNGNLPTDAYHASSTDLINWTVDGPILTHLGGSSFEKEQIADIRALEVAGASFLYYSGVDDTGAAAAVGLAQYAGPLSAFAT